MERVMRTRIPAGLFAIALAMTMPQIARSDMKAAGQAEYQANCAVCHGLEARGDGPMADVLDPKPPNLTLLSRANGGFFPYGEVFDTIDGQDQVKAHGPRDMPIWGEAFLPSGNSHGTDDELLAYGRILVLTRYLETLQVE